MTGRENLEALWASFQLLDWKEKALRLAIAAGLIAILAGGVVWGAHVGAHVGAKGWLCGETVKGGMACVRDPAAPPT
jgi:hypothetical protein